MYPVLTNPGEIIVRKGKGPLRPDCKKAGFVQQSVGVGESFNALTIVNVLFWPGFIVDVVTGSMQKYPSHMSVMMMPVNQ